MHAAPNENYYPRPEGIGYRLRMQLAGLPVMLHRDAAHHAIARRLRGRQFRRAMSENRTAVGAAL